jgi:hypothetical protein
MNILKDPPKSITTRRIDKVGQTSDITQMIDDSGNRACEAILQYARGVNPMVSVSYSNEGTNGGQYKNLPYGASASDSTLNFGQRQAFLPYRIGDNFRAPVVPPSQLYPLSRLPRIWTTAFTKSGFADFSKKMKVCDNPDTVKEVKKNIIKSNVKPTAVYKIEKPLEKPFEVKYVIKPIINSVYDTKFSGTDRTVQNVLKPNKEINYDNLHAYSSVNKNNQNMYVNNNEVFTDRYLQQINKSSQYTNKGAPNSIQCTILDDVLGLVDIKEKNALNVSYDTQKAGAYTKTDLNYDDLELERNIPIYDIFSNNKGNEKVSYIHDDIVLERTLPEYNMATNIKQNTEKTLEHEYIKEQKRNMPLTTMIPNSKTFGETNISSTDYKLNSKISVGGYEGRAQIPNSNRSQSVRENFESEKAKMSRMVNSQFEGRYQSNFYPNNY